MKKHANQAASEPAEKAPYGLWVRKGGFDHLYGIASCSANTKTKNAFLHLSCDCGVESIDIGMNLDTLKTVSAALARAVRALEEQDNLMGGANVH